MQTKKQNRKTFPKASLHGFDHGGNIPQEHNIHYTKKLRILISLTFLCSVRVTFRYLYSQHQNDLDYANPGTRGLNSSLLPFVPAPRDFLSVFFYSPLLYMALKYE